MRNFKLICGLIFLLLLGYAANAQKLYSKTVDTTNMYIDERTNLQEDDDCSVRALSVVMNESYYLNIERTSEFGRESRKGMSLRGVYNLLRKYHSDKYAGMAKIHNANAYEFVNNTAEIGNSYLLVATDHIVALKYDIDTNKWYLYGNWGDTRRPYLLAIKIKENG